MNATVSHAILQQETKLRELQVKAKTLLETQMRACEDHVTPATKDTPEVKGRLRTDAEKAAVQTILDEAKGIKARIDAAKSDANMLEELDRLTAGMQAAQSQQQAGPRRQGGLKSLGQQFVDSDAYKWLKNTSRQQGTAWSSPSAELSGIELFGATLTEASGGASLLTPDYRPGILEYLQRALVVADLIAPGTTDGASVSYMVESAPTNAAATVAEGAAKPESTLVFTARTDTVRKIATWLPVTDEMLEDVSQIRSYIDGRLRMFVQLAEDDQLLNGDGIAPNIEGIRNRAGLQADQVRGADTNMDAIRKQITNILVNALIQADAIVMHPTNWQTIELAKDANGQYYGSGPFAAPGVPRLWGLPVAVTVAMTSGVALPGAFRLGAQFFRKGGLTTAASNSHNDYFVKNLTAIRAEERGALAVYRPGAFGEVTGLV
jgi:HK97 family phage major capsid protein